MLAFGLLRTLVGLWYAGAEHVAARAARGIRDGAGVEGDPDRRAHPPTTSWLCKVASLATNSAQHGSGGKGGRLPPSLCATAQTTRLTYLVRLYLASPSV